MSSMNSSTVTLYVLEDAAAMVDLTARVALVSLVSTADDDLFLEQLASTCSSLSLPPAVSVCLSVTAVTWCHTVKPACTSSQRSIV